MTLSTDQKFLFSGSFDGSICIWSATQGTPLGKVNAHPGHFVTCMLSCNVSGSTVLLSGGLQPGKGEIKVWAIDGNSGALKSMKTQNTKSAIYSMSVTVDFSGQQPVLVTGHDNGAVKLWQLDSSFNHRGFWNPHKSGSEVFAVAGAPAQKVFATTGTDGAVCAFQFAQASSSRQGGGHGGNRGRQQQQQQQQQRPAAFTF